MTQFNFLMQLLLPHNVSIPILQNMKNSSSKKKTLEQCLWHEWRWRVELNKYQCFLKHFVIFFASHKITEREKNCIRVNGKWGRNWTAERKKQINLNANKYKGNVLQFNKYRESCQRCYCIIHHLQKTQRKL